MQLVLFISATQTSQINLFCLILLYNEIWNNVWSNSSKRKMIFMLQKQTVRIFMVGI
jgi:hypothetical protein